MINIYSIKEVIEASNNILNRSKKKNIVISEKFTSVKNDKPLVLVNEITEGKLIKENQNQMNSNNKIQVKKSIKPLKKNKLIDELFLKFDKKIKKNTLKLIYELQKDVLNLNKTKNLLQQSNKEIKTQLNNFSNKIKKLNSLNNILNEDKDLLKNKIQVLSDKLNASQIEIKNLKKNKIELEDQLKEKSLMKEQITSLSNELNTSNNVIENLKLEKTKLEKEISEYKSQNEISKKKIYDISEVENRNKFFQEENLRIGSELLDIQKKHDILKNEVERYENQKSNLISKINSVNDALNDTNILTEVFDNNVKSKINRIDDKKNKVINKADLNEKIKDIFSK